MNLQSAFPSLEVAIVDEVYSQCDSNMQSAIEQLQTLFPDAYVSKSQASVQADDPVAEPWTPPTQSPAQSPKRLPRALPSPSKAPKQLDSDFLRSMMPSGSDRSRKKSLNGKEFTGWSEVARYSSGKIGGSAHKNETLSNGLVAVNGHSEPNDRAKSQVYSPAAASLPFLQHLLPPENPVAKASQSFKSASSGSADLSPVRCASLHPESDCTDP